MRNLWIIILSYTKNVEIKYVFHEIIAFYEDPFWIEDMLQVKRINKFLFGVNFRLRLDWADEIVPDPLLCILIRPRELVLQCIHLNLRKFI